MLTALAKKHGCDKADANHTHLGKSYCDVYERYFASIRHEKLVIVEIGVREGASIRMWQEYFPNAEIHGLDIDPDAKKAVQEDDRTFIHIVDQNNTQQLVDFIQSMKTRPIDIVIDDGSHIVRHQLHSFLLLSPHARRFYIIEDLRCSYAEFIEGHDLRKIWPGMKYNNPKDALVNDRAMLDKWLLGTLKNMDFHKTDRLSAIHCHPMVVVLEFTW